MDLYQLITLIILWLNFNYHLICDMAPFTVLLDSDKYPAQFHEAKAFITVKQ